MELEARITKVEFGPRLSCNGIKFSNHQGNKVVVTLEPGLPFGERAMSKEIFMKFGDFFQGKLIADPVESQATSITE